MMTSNGAWLLVIDKSVEKALARIPLKDAAALLDVVYSLAVNPLAGDIQKMKGEQNTWRRRHGSYRIFFEINTSARIVHIYHLERRTSSTY